ncbi:hypothetical protein HFU84_11225 [Acidithiobacillus sp. CV18-2]|uniref:Uncharacterized protein n=1 Tax=Igneacidithiobacillus copahuensis TaxID=2724909 RepID=A0AAE2YMA1_9PROT|nr:hypothetical protein [Igneacidithiobacillus copahuensis]MBU2753728.1 hypothetical protein [Acidithiobacillus sp. CV18-3]MBU2758280.1 hypothetical protein [Acidithiobacillus sp. BN09-2]MBU2778067.1 hypothetical protein [Acidithiobacillus sp. CV18-2]MBU2796043.1 hypothetical protein [Acidithiobacillus sp. VAN18-2]MBU2798034.1 hypothetical protein [Acidithiobacillus sp. VAN18-4]UTV80314.1 hypothetical protein MQE22_09830 [Acidithiobacillus sp. YTS05]
MANGNAAAETVVALTPKQWEGLGKVGDAALQLQNLLQMFRDVLNELPNAIDTDKLLAKYQPQLDALREATESLQGMLTVDGGVDRLKQLLSEVKDAQLDKTIGELLSILNNLQKSGFFSSLATLSGELKCPLIGENPEDMVNKLRSAMKNLQYYWTSAKQGIGVIGNVAGELQLPERLDELQEMADQWLQMAKRAQKLVQGDAPSVQARLEGLLDMAEILGGQMSVALGTIKDTAPELLHNADLNSTIGTVGIAGKRWLQVAIRVKNLAAGDNGDLVSRVEMLLDQVEKVAGFAGNAGFFLQAGKDGLAAVQGIVTDLDLPEKLDILAEEAEKWGKIALRAKRIAIGDAKAGDVADSINNLLDHAETISETMRNLACNLERQGIHLGDILSPRGDLSIAACTATDFLGEMWRDGTIKNIGADISQGALAWMEIAHIGGTMLKGDAADITTRVKGLVKELHDAKLMDMVPEALALVGKLQKAGLLHKVNLVLDKALPLLPSDAAFASGVDKAVKALEQTQVEMKDEANKGGGIFGLMKIVFAKDTQFVLKFAVRFASIFLKAWKQA